MPIAETQLKALMVASLAGDAAAYRGLLGTLGDQLRRYYRRRLPSSDANVEDLVQEALIAIHSKRETYDTSLPFTPWLHAIARYKLLDYLRRKRLRVTIPLDDAGEICTADENEAAMMRRDLEKLLASLPARSQALIRQVKLDGFSTAEVAEKSGKSEIAVRVGLHRALKILSNGLGGGKRHADR